MIVKVSSWGKAMAEVPRVLMLGGTEEAVRLNHLLDERSDISVVTSLAGRTRDPTELKGEVMTGGFGGLEGLKNFLIDQSIVQVIDATHPFAAQITDTAFLVCKNLGIDYLRLERPPWKEVPGDLWIKVRDVKEAACSLDKFNRIFLSIGRQELPAFLPLQGKQFLIRSIEPVSFDPTGSTVRFIQARGPFSLPEELALLADHQIEVLVSKNSGGDATYAKISAAQEMRLPVIMIERPAGPDCKAYSDADSLFQAFLLGRSTCT